MTRVDRNAGWEVDPGLGVTIVGNVSTGRVIKEITIDQAAYSKLEPEFRDSLERFLALINQYHETSEEQRRSIKDSIDALAKMAEGVKVRQLVENEEKVEEIKSKQITLAKNIVDYLPALAESIASTIPLAPFGMVIGKGAEYFARLIRQILAA